MPGTGSRRSGAVGRSLLLPLVLVGILFLLYRWMSSGPDPDVILVSRAHIEGLRQDHLLQTGSLPSPRQERALIEKYIDDEVLVREARKMGLDRGDPIVRRRLIQKMVFLIQDLSDKSEPTEAEIRQFFEERADRFMAPARLSLVHVFLDRGRSSGRLEERVKAILARLASGADPRDLGDPFPLGQRFSLRTRGDLEKTFGSGFAEAVMALPIGDWFGPVESSYGFHLVRIESRTEARRRRLDEVRSQVVRELKAKRREEAKRAAIRGMRNHYQIRFLGLNPPGPAEPRTEGKGAVQASRGLATEP